MTEKSIAPAVGSGIKSGDREIYDDSCVTCVGVTLNRPFFRMLVNQIDNKGG